jgi:YD repeat-containing protein
MNTNVSRRRIDAVVSATDEFAGEVVYPDGLTETAIDALLQDVYGELASDEHAAQAAYRYDFNDQRRVSRARRRAGREALRALPVAWAFDGEAA